MSIVKFYRNDPNAPKPNMPAHLGSNCIITCKGKLLLERRVDSDTWGLVGGGCKKWEEPDQAMAREVLEELGWRIPRQQCRKIKVYGAPGRIAGAPELRVSAPQLKESIALASNFLEHPDAQHEARLDDLDRLLG